MRLWGKVASGMTYLIGAIFLVVAVVVPEARRESIAVAVISIAVALFGIPALVRLLSSITGDEEILTNGVAGSATITSLKPTGWSYNRYSPIVNFRLSVEASGASYPVEVKQSVDPELLQRLAPGAVVGIRVDRENHKKVVIDLREPIRSGTQPAASASAENQGETAQSTKRREINSLWPFIRWGFLIFGLIFFRLSCEEDYYEKGGARVQGIVLQKTYSQGTRSIGGRGGSPSKHSVSYRFTTKEGRTIEGRYDVLPGTWQELQKGEPVTVEYLPDAPDTNRIPEQRARSLTWTLMALVPLVASAVLFIISWRQRRVRAQ